LPAGGGAKQVTKLDTPILQEEHVRQKEIHQRDHTLSTRHNTQQQTMSLQQAKEHQIPKCQYQQTNTYSRSARSSYSQIDLHTPQTPSKRNPKPHTSI